MLPHLLILGACALPLDAEPFLLAHRAADEALIDGRFEAARQEARKALELEPGHPTLLYLLACVEARAGEVERSLSWLDEAHAAGFMDPNLATWDEDLLSLRGDSRFAAWVARVAESKAEAESEPHGSSFELVVDEQERVRIACTEFATEGERWVQCLDGRSTLRLLDPSTGHLLRELETGADAITMDLTADGDWLVSIHAGGVLQLWNLEAAEGPVWSRDELGLDWKERNVRVQWVAGGERILVFVGARRELRDRDGRLLATWLGGRDWAGGEGADVMAFCVRTGDDQVELRSARTGDPLGEILSFPERVVGLGLSTDGSLLGVGREDGRFTLLEVESRRVRWEQHLVDPWGLDVLNVPTIRFDQASERVALCTTTGFFVHVYGIEAGEQVHASPHLGGRMGGEMGLDWGGRWLYGDQGRYRFDLAAGKRHIYYPVLWPRDLHGGHPEWTLITLAYGVSAVIDEETGRELFRRIDLRDGARLVQAPGGWFDGDLGAIPRTSLQVRVVKQTDLTHVRHLEEIARDIFDPRRIRAAQAGVELVAPDVSW